MLTYARNHARELLEWAVLEALDVRLLLRRPLACSWRSFFTCNTTAAVALFLYSRARRTSSSVWLSLLVFSLSLCVSVSRRFSSLPALCSLCSLVSWSLVSALLSAGVLLPSLPELSSRLCSASVSSLPRLRLSLVAWPFTYLKN